MYVHHTYWVFLVVSAVLYWAAPRAWRTWLLAILSATYLFGQDPAAIVGALITIAVVLAVFSHTRANTQRAESVALMLAGLLLAQLAYHKYGHFGAATTATVTKAAIPLGLSFLTFKLIDFSMRTLKGEVPKQPVDRTLLYFFLFPAYPAGPMARIDEFYRHRDPELTGEAVAEGLTRIVQGLVKKFAIADAFLMAFLHRGADPMSVRMATEPWLRAWGDVFVLQVFVYLDFSAYSDLAVGGARLFGFRIPENFRYPLFAHNISEFWKRWHITLANLCRAYIYMPMLARTRNVQISMIVTMIVIALWHGATPGWFLWGAWHAAGLTVYAFYRQRVGPAPEDPGLFDRVWGWALTLTFVASACTFLVDPGPGGWRKGLHILSHLVGLS